MHKIRVTKTKAQISILIPDSLIGITEKPPAVDVAAENDLHFRHYVLVIDLYKHHLESLLKLNFFTIALTGAIASFYFSQANKGLIRFSLVFPIVVNFAFGTFTLIASFYVTPFLDEVKRVSDRLNFSCYPAVEFLAYFLRLTALQMGLAGVGLLIATILRVPAP